MRPLLVVLCLVLAAGTDAQTIRTVPNFNTIGVEVSFAAPPAAGTEVDMCIRKETSTNAHRRIHSLSRIANDAFAGSAFYLEAGTTYSVRLESAAFASNLFVSVTTRANEFPQATNLIYHVAPSGNDGNTGSSFAQAFAHLEHAIGFAGPGDTIMLHDGRYYEGDLDLPTSGTPTDPLVLRAAPGAHSIIDGTETNFSPTWVLFDPTNGIYRTSHDVALRTAYINGGHLYRYQSLNDIQTDPWGVESGYYADGVHMYVRFPGGLPGTNVVTVPRYTVALNMDNEAYIHVVGIEFCYFGAGSSRKGIYINDSSHILVDRCAFHHTGASVAIKRAATFNTIQRCFFSEWPLADWDWDAVKSGSPSYEAGAVLVFTSNETNEGNVIRYNIFSNLFDGVLLYSGDPEGPTMNMDFHDNLITYCRDDAVETDGVGSNNRLYNNRIFDFNSGISVAPASVGPTYIFRNVFGPAPSIGPEGRLPIKLNVNSPLSTDWVYVYHNTSWTDSLEHDGFTFWQYSKWTNVTMRNNIFIGSEFALRNNADPNPVDMDYDNIYTTKDTRGFRWLGVDYFSLTNFTTATGLEPNGLSTNASFVDSSTDDYYLSTNSCLIDQGVAIPGINNGFIGGAPDVGAFEHGARAFSVSNASDSARTAWQVGPFTFWSLEYSPVLDPPAWTSVSDVVEARTWQVVFEHATNASPGFYRVVRVPESDVTNAPGSNLP